MIDTHCHITYEPLLGQVDAVVQRALDAGVQRLITIGTSPADAVQSVALAQRFPNVYAAVGLHPHYAGQVPARQALHAALDELARRPKVVAVGEMGLDRHYPDPPFELQQQALRWQLEWAAGTDLPIIIHNREATSEALAILRESGISPARFNFHCFTGSQQELDAILAFGAMVGFTGIVTFKSAASLAQSARTVPSERLLIETDSPYLTPEPFRKVKTNEPCYVVHVARFLAQIRGVSEKELVAATDANAQRFFRLPAW